MPPVWRAIKEIALMKYLGALALESRTTTTAYKKSIDECTQKLQQTCALISDEETETVIRKRYTACGNLYPFKVDIIVTPFLKIFSYLFCLLAAPISIQYSTGSGSIF